MANTAVPEMGSGKKKDKSGGKKEKKAAKSLMLKQLQRREELMVCLPMGLLFLGLMQPIFAPSEEREANRDATGASNADIPLPENDEIISNKREACGQAQARKRQTEKVRSLEDFAFSEENNADGAEMELPDSRLGQGSFKDYLDNGGGHSSVAACRDINRELGSFYEESKVGGEREELKRQVEELTTKSEERERQAGGIDDQVALMGKSYELAAKYMGQNGQDGAAVQAPAIVQNDNDLGQPAVAVQATRKRMVSGLQWSLSDAEFTRRYNQPGNYDFNTAVGSGYAFGKNTIAACIHQDQMVMDGQQVELRLLEPLQTGNPTIPCNMVVSSTGRVQGEWPDITVPSVQYQGNILSVELAVRDNEGMKGLYIEASLKRGAVKEAMTSTSGGLGTGILFA